jgi:hypothetical protein
MRGRRRIVGVWGCEVAWLVARATNRRRELREVGVMGVGYDMRLEIVGSCLRMAALLLSKNAGYGNSAADPLMVFSRLGARERLGVRMDDKLSRLARGLVDGQEDTRGDLCGYLHLDGIVGRMGEGVAPVSREEVMGLWGEVMAVVGGQGSVVSEEGEVGGTDGHGQARTGTEEGEGKAGEVYWYAMVQEARGRVVELETQLGVVTMERDALREGIRVVNVELGEKQQYVLSLARALGERERSLAQEGAENTEGECTDGQGQARTGTEEELREELELERGRCWDLAERVVWWREQVEKVKGELGEQLAAEREISERLSVELVRKEAERKEYWERARESEREADGLPGLREELAEVKQWWEAAVERHRKSAEQAEYWRNACNKQDERVRELQAELAGVRGQLERLELERGARSWTVRRFGWW